MPLSILLLEDSAADAELVTIELQRHDSAVTTERVDSRDAFIGALLNRKPDVVLSDHGMSAFNALAALTLVQELRPSVPLIVLSGAIDPHTASMCIRAGAEDVFLKQDITELHGSIQRAVGSRRALEKLTPRQLQVLRLIAEGRTAAEIGQRLDVSAKTVENHRTHIMTRLDLHDAGSVIRFAAQIGFVPRM